MSTVFMAWSSERLPSAVPGPWSEFRLVADNVAMIESSESLSRIYHELKRDLPPSAALVVAPLSVRPKAKGLAPGASTWLRDRLQP